MRPFAFLSATLLGVAGVSYSSYELLKPKNIAQYLQWQGYKLVSDNESTWKAIYEENRGFFVSFKELRN
ncbi:hypothetical protein A6V39_01245 [Candidatus Mycoplasma haematobovis]|uniref:Uncharacterized protein n=1 Tax=Candidatus Mycoplasma haematobovis TaxID=432608 RepID=A0A1A9QG18_9MOLU|nr:hypothetical protein [Candidatus Mycoplasma haematobovis]OAL10679.1 hypothetical protein A6V39_01245 [Candidatus Mycoplasma haematobovis]